MSEFWIGQRVACVDDRESMGRLKNGAKYTISEVIERPDWYGDIGVNVVGVQGGHCILGIGWRSSRFLPLPFKAEDTFRKIARDVTEGKTVELVE